MGVIEGQIGRRRLKLGEGEHSPYAKEEHVS
jgi:hypothetical protein